MSASKNKIKVLIVDDSAIVRQTVKYMLQDSPTVEVVGVAMNPNFAIKKIYELEPDVLLLDIQMPEMDGLTFLKTLMRQKPIPTIIFSSFAPEGSENALKAFEYGAVEVIEKPRLALPQDLERYKYRLIKAIESAALAKVGRTLQKTVEKPGKQVTGKPISVQLSSKIDLIAIGASTGGPEAIRKIVENLPPDTPPVVVVQHMPPGFTNLFAKRLNELSKVTVLEASGGEKLEKGLVLIAPGDKHLVVKRSGTNFVAELDDSPPVNRHKPSVDMLFWSVAKNVGPAAVGIILTGMGADGVRGMLEMKKRGALTIAQDEETSVVFGMPKVAIARGAANYVLPIDEIPIFVNKLLKQQRVEV